MIRTLIFDWDGTLHNTEHLYGMAFRKAYRYLVSQGLAKEREYSDHEVSVYLGMNARDMWNTFMPELAEEYKKTAGGMIGNEMDRLVQEGEAMLYEGVPETLTKLKQDGYHLVILSNCRHAYLENHRKAFHLDQWFDDYYAAEDYRFIPKEEIFPFIAKRWEGKYMVIGDRASDLKTAAVHHISSIGCAYGFGTQEELRTADYVANDIRDIIKVLQQ